MDRKQFIQKTGAAALLISLGISLESCESESVDPDNNVGDNGGQGPETVIFNITDNPYDVLQQADGWLLHPEENILLVNVSNDLRAFTSVCTHSGCSRDWSYQSLLFTCGCHGSRFNNAGGVETGPAARSLKEFSIQVDDDVVTVTLS